MLRLHRCRRCLVASLSKGYAVKPRAFTLVELLTVAVIMIILMAIAVIPIRSMMRNNSQKQATNQTTALLANARAQALQQGRVIGFVMFEESTGSGTQTAMQMIVEDRDQRQYSPPNAPPILNTVFVALNSQRHYVPRGVRIAGLLDNAGRPVVTGDASASENRSRVVLFDSRGHLLLRSGIAAPASAAYADWKLAAPEDVDIDPATGDSIPSMRGASSPGFLIYSAADYNAKGFTPATQGAAAAWIQQNADILVINAYTGNIIR
jgi:type II secretory pathway pseudopilin PulG